MEERGSLGKGGEEINCIYRVYDIYLGGVWEDILYILIILLEKVGRSVEVERNDSGVGSDSGHSGSAKAGETQEVVQAITTFDLFFYLKSHFSRLSALTVSLLWLRALKRSVPSAF